MCLVLRFFALALLLPFFLKVHAILNPELCDAFLKLEPRKVFRLALPPPWMFSRWVAYRWCASSETGVRFRCEDSGYTEVIKGDHCDYDFNIFPNATALPYVYCGGRFVAESSGEDLVVSLEASIAPVFKCYVEAIEPNVVVEPNFCDCKTKKMNSSSKLPLTKKIVGGKAATVSEYPMAAALVDPEINMVFCGGTIISSRHVLTAAHCFSNPENERSKVLVGAHDVNKISRWNNSMLYVIQKTDIHPDFKNGSLSPNDIAIVTILGEFKFTEEVRPACLPVNQYHDRFIDGSFLYVLGWGLNSFGGVRPNMLQVGRVVGINLMTCLKDIPQVNSHQLCTYADTQDACQFDSGGPVLWENPAIENLMVVGIISYGKGCANYEPSVNTRVSSFIGWIEQVTSGAKFCRAE